MIVAVEGPSAAGKTTWCRRHAEHFVPEYTPTGTEPDDSNADAQSAYWVAVNSERWAAALALESSTGLAICDSDPLKLHYSWCLSMIGAAPRTRWELELKAVRQAFAVDALGLADIVLLSVPSLERLLQQKLGDTTRRRGHFDLHAQLREPLVAWYEAVDRLDPGRVIWEHPSHGLPASLPGPRERRSSVHLLDALAASLPAP